MDAKMNVTKRSIGTTARAPAGTAALGVVAALLILAVLTNATTQLPVISSDRGALVALVVVGLAMCATGGIGKAISRHGWKHVVTLLGGVLGALILAIFVAALFGVPVVANDRAAFEAITLIGVVKVLISAVDGLVTRRAQG
jgi:energy-converting hydrogenase Eha subunit A